MKTLDDAIGCWTNRRQYGDLTTQASVCLESAKRCRALVRKNGAPSKLLDELELLALQIKQLSEINKSAISRCENIVRDGLDSTAPHYVP